GLGSNFHLRNNIFVSANPQDSPAFGASTLTAYSSSDYNGFYWPEDVQDPLAWNAPPSGVKRRFDTPPEQANFGSLAELAEATGQERHGTNLDVTAFRSVRLPDVSDIRKVYSPDAQDFRLTAEAPAVDAGTPIPNVTDGFTGSAPDLGAIELGVPHPR